MREELYLCDLGELFAIYSPDVKKELYDDGVFKYDSSQNTLPMRGIKGWYSKVKAEGIERRENKLVLVQQADPVSGAIEREGYRLGTGWNLGLVETRRNEIREIGIKS